MPWFISPRLATPPSLASRTVPLQMLQGHPVHWGRPGPAPDAHSLGVGSAGSVEEASGWQPHIVEALSSVLTL